MLVDQQHTYRIGSDLMPALEPYMYGFQTGCLKSGHLRGGDELLVANAITRALLAAA